MRLRDGVENEIRTVAHSTRVERLAGQQMGNGGGGTGVLIETDCRGCLPCLFFWIYACVWRATMLPVGRPLADSTPSSWSTSPSSVPVQWHPRGGEPGA